LKSIKQICALAPVIPVLVIDDVTIAKPLAQALVKGGLPVLEVTLRTEAALDVIKAMSEVEGAIVGAGTILTPEDLSAAKNAGASFGVSPGSSDDLLKAAEVEGFPLLPGATTATEVMNLLAQGYDMLKFFPAAAAGGIDMLKSLAGPLPGVSFCPTGGINPGNVQAYLALPNVICVGGTWVTPKEMLAAGDWAGIEQLARQASGSASNE